MMRLCIDFFFLLLCIPNISTTGINCFCNNPTVTFKKLRNKIKSLTGQTFYEIATNYLQMLLFWPQAPDAGSNAEK